MIFKFEIEETLTKKVELDAETKEEALRELKRKYHNEEIILDSSDFTSVNFEQGIEF